ncbi:MAG: SCP2 sterol-binding domain-containing protein [Gammaproteobacteria bacterium]|nr:SCP2 sterol-binding domain-containing protein [Gammaproteobacteria bacterium]MDH5694116.1 SCP2 sterol-binding domain-containing protein [Gammaproteobacteria bacterium]
MSAVLFPPVFILEATLNRVLALDPEAMDRLARMQGKLIAIEVAGLGLTLYLQPELDGVVVKTEMDRQADVTIKGAPFSLLRASLQDKRGLFSGDVTLEGDVELGQQVQRLLERLNIDWEEGLSHFLGDTLSHQAGDFLRGAFGFLNQAVSEFGKDSAEYLKEESQQLPSRYEVQAFSNEVDTLRADADRLRAGVERLREKIEV